MRRMYCICVTNLKNRYKYRATWHGKEEFYKQCAQHYITWPILKTKQRNTFPSVLISSACFTNSLSGPVLLYPAWRKFKKLFFDTHHTRSSGWILGHFFNSCSPLQEQESFVFPSGEKVAEEKPPIQTTLGANSYPAPPPGIWNILGRKAKCRL
jgi:hypothetical protein